MSETTEHKSAYLRRSSNQKVKWRPWSEDAFKTAADEDKPVFLSSGAVWCHWCHVMAHECFYNDEIAGLLNDNFVCIKLDRDERPDIDRRYQTAVALMGSQTGWPLNVFLTPDKRPFYGGTYFPPEARAGIPGFKSILNSIITFYRSNKDEISEYTGKVIDSLEPGSAVHEKLDPSQLDTAISKTISAFDHINGGFGLAPKFPMPGATQFLINRYSYKPEVQLEDAIKKTLTSMALGGFHDHIGGGFHRYSTDREWIMPHFEKMADDNALLLRNYLSAYYLLGDTFYREVAEGIINFTRTVLSDPEGGFYASQDADVTPHDEGGYFTWTKDELRDILDNEEYKIVSQYLLHDDGSMEHDPSKYVLYARTRPEDLGLISDKGQQETRQLLANAKIKLLNARNRRETPFVDNTMYTSNNGMFITSFMLGYRVLNDTTLMEFAVKSLDRIISQHYIGGKLYHSKGTEAFLDDYVHIIDALLSVYEVTAEKHYIDLADKLMQTCIIELWDETDAGFYDSADQFFGIRFKAIEDIPHPSPNSICISILLKLHFITGSQKYYEFAEKTLELFASTTRGMGIHAGYYYCALDAYFNSLNLKIYSAPSSGLSEAVISAFNPYMSVLYREGAGGLIPCFKNTCYNAIQTPEEWKYFLRENVYNVRNNH